MIEKIAKTITISTVIFCMSLLGFLYFIEYKFYSIKKDTYHFLLTKHEDQDIYKVDTTFGKGQIFIATVIFNDEKDVVYEFAKVDGEIIQLYPDPKLD